MCKKKPDDRFTHSQARYKHELPATRILSEPDQKSRGSLGPLTSPPHQIQRPCVSLLLRHENLRWPAARHPAAQIKKCFSSLLPWNNHIKLYPYHPQFSHFNQQKGICCLAQCVFAGNRQTSTCMHAYTLLLQCLSTVKKVVLRTKMGAKKNVICLYYL